MISTQHRHAHKVAKIKLYRDFPYILLRELPLGKTGLLFTSVHNAVLVTLSYD